MTIPAEMTSARLDSDTIKIVWTDCDTSEVWSRPGVDEAVLAHVGLDPATWELDGGTQAGGFDVLTESVKVRRR